MDQVAVDDVGFYACGVLVVQALLTGEASRALPDPRLRNAVRNAWENERPFPGQLMQRVSRLLLWMVVALLVGAALIWLALGSPR